MLGNLSQRLRGASISRTSVVTWGVFVIIALRFFAGVVK